MPEAPVLSRFVQHPHDVRGLDHLHNPRGDADPGMVVDDVEDLEGLPVPERDMGHVGLPALVGQVGHEASERALGALVGLEGDEAACLEHPKDRRDRRGPAVALRQVVVDRRRTRVEPVVGQRLVQGHDLVSPHVRNPGRATMGSPAPRLETGRALQAVAGQELEEPSRTDVVGRGELFDGAAAP